MSEEGYLRTCDRDRISAIVSQTKHISLKDVVAENTIAL